MVKIWCKWQIFFCFFLTFFFVCYSLFLFLFISLTTKKRASGMGAYRFSRIKIHTTGSIRFCFYYISKPTERIVTSDELLERNWVVLYTDNVYILSFLMRLILFRLVSSFAVRQLKLHFYCHSWSVC